jgi:hypothetical protein
MTRSVPSTDFIALKIDGKWGISPCPGAQHLCGLPSFIPSNNEATAKASALSYARETHRIWQADSLAGVYKKGRKECFWHSWPYGQHSSTEWIDE